MIPQSFSFFLMPKPLYRKAPGDRKVQALVNQHSAIDSVLDQGSRRR